MLSLFLPYKFPGLNDYIAQERIHRMAGANMKKKFTDLVKLSVPAKAERFTVPVSISFEWYEANMKRDPDNIIFAKKFILDGLVAAKVLPNDTQKWILAMDDSWTVDASKVGVMVSIAEYD